ncbi:hypothetical protein BJX61DRAFT_487241 [Aspergillus egyptiacus]|nr:hypothetical protein BJX61DRAFT_487241 [Aspergillus egyptiacus]
MEIPPKARGTGRSGPRRRTGCLTCRARKVRCDEAKPTCANCTRLRLQCVYKSVIVSGIRTKSSRTRSASSTAQNNEEVSPRSIQDLGVVIRPNENVQHQLHEHPERHSVLPPNSPKGTVSEYPGPFDMLGFIGEITSDFQQKHLDLSNWGTSTPSQTAVAEVDGGLFHDERNMAWGPEVGSGITESDSPRGSSGGELREEQLLEYFRESEPPPTIFGPVDLEWEYVKEVMIVQSKDCRALLLAIYCYSDTHQAWVNGMQWKLGPTYHAQASSEIQSCVHGELISLDGWRSSTTPYLYSTYLLLQRFHSRTRSWTGPAHLIISWISLLDIKALIAGRDGDPLTELIDLPRSPLPSPSSPNPTSNPSEPPLSSSSSPPEEEQDPPANPTYLITTTLTTPALTFYLHTQQLTRRIITIDLHHRPRGTLSDEYEVLQIAHTVLASLESLWTTRPKILDLHSAPEDSLLATLAAPLATSIVRTFRIYVANFLALFVYLHRVAFAIYPRTDRVYAAVDQIIHLAREEARRGVGVGSGVPVAFVWPLFIAALEGSREQREWIVGEMKRMADRGGSRHPNAGKVVVLLEEMTRRQDVGRTWADSRCVRRELFVDSFVMI